jgi:tungstate transport system ATP-binding protein
LLGDKVKDKAPAQTPTQTQEASAAPREILYRLRGVSKVYNGRQTLALEELEIGRSEILALVGPSGAGKSTLLRLLNFLETPTAGTIGFEEQEYGPGQRVPLTVRRRVTTVFQRPVLLQRTVEANVAYGLRLRRQKELMERVERTLQEVGLANMARAQARTLSGGEAQRVALARAIILEPDALLLDEPTANLDPYNVGLIEQIVRRRNQERGTTFVLVTHNVFQAHRLATRVALLLDGRIVEVQDVQDFFERPQDPRTAAFVRGEMVY